MRPKKTKVGKKKRGKVWKRKNPEKTDLFKINECNIEREKWTPEMVSNFRNRSGLIKGMDYKRKMYRQRERERRTLTRVKP